MKALHLLLCLLSCAFASGGERTLDHGPGPSADMDRGRAPANRPKAITRSGAGGDIPDAIGIEPSGVFRSSVWIPHSFDGRISDVTVELHGLDHTWAGDLTIRLIHPDGRTSLDLVKRPGRGSYWESLPGVLPYSSQAGFDVDFRADFQYSFGDNASVLFFPTASGGPPDGWMSLQVVPTGVYRPSSNPNAPDAFDRRYEYTSASFFKTFGGRVAAGEWTLEITDWTEADTGALGSWTLTICSSGCPAPRAKLGDELLKVTAFHPAGENFAGYNDAIAADGEILLIGGNEYDQDRALGSKGRVHVFDLVSGRQLSTLRPSDLGENSNFGASVAISGNIAVVGAYGQQGEVTGLASGAVYVYDLSRPEKPRLLRKITPADATGAESLRFGIAVAMNRHVIAVNSARGTDRLQGLITLFDVRSGEELARITCSDGNPGDGFGNFMAMDERRLVVGAFDARNHEGFGAGAAYVFDITRPRRPIQTFKLAAADGTVSDNFGMGVGLDGRFAVIGAPFRDQGEIDGERLIRGGAYLFDVYTGEQIAQFLPVDPIRPGDRASISMEGMGYGVGISGGLVIIGAPYAHDENYGMYGAAYLYDIRKPREPVYIKRFSPSDGQWSDWFGMSAKIEDGRIIIGAPSSPTIRNWGGKALVYQGF